MFWKRVKLRMKTGKIEPLRASFAAQCYKYLVSTLSMGNQRLGHNIACTRRRVYADWLERQILKQGIKEG